MAERKDPLLNLGSVSPLFNKMDALLARHRGPATPEQIPVLTEEASVMQIPTLTEEVRHDHTVMAIKPKPQDNSGLMFHPAEFAWMNPDPQPVEEKAPEPPLVEVPMFSATPAAPVFDAPIEPVFLDLPVLDLQSLNPEKEPGPEPLFELEIDTPAPEAAVVEEIAASRIAQEPEPETAAVMSISAPQAPLQSRANTEPAPDKTDSVAASQDEPPAVSEPISTQPASASTAREPVPSNAAVVAELSAAVKSAQARFADDETLSLSMRTAIPEEYLIDLDSVDDERDLTLPQIRTPISVYDTLKNSEFSEPAAETPAAPEVVSEEHPLAAAETAEPEQEIIEAIEAVELIEVAAPESLEIIELSEMPQSMDVADETTMAPVQIASEPAPEVQEEVLAPPSPRLDAAAVDEITAHVGAHIAVDITTEVAQLAKQHFTRIMQGYYQQALQQLTEEISRDLEAQLAPRIIALVRQELGARGLIDPQD